MITRIITLDDLQKVLINNPGIVIIKYGAEWCGPCKRIEKQVHAGFAQMPSNILCVLVDIDQSPDIYAFLKKKRILNGVPGIVAHYKETAHYVPDDCVLGADPPEIDAFFKRCFDKAMASR
jgi:thiol:disulfide interchange protein